MPAPAIFAVLPAERAGLAASIAAAGVQVVVDLCHGQAEVPPGAWVRVARTEAAPGDSGIIAAAGPAVAGRACWLETTEVVPVPEGFSGLVLRGSGSGGRSGTADVRELASRVPAGVQALLDWPHEPTVAAPRCAGRLLSDVLLPAAGLGPNLAGRLARLGTGDFRRVGEVQVAASLASPALGKLARGGDLAEAAAGYLAADDAFERAWPAGPGLLVGRALLQAHGSLHAILSAYAPVSISAAAGSVAPAPAEDAEIAAPRHGPIAIVGLGCRLPRAPSPKALWDGLVAGFDAIIEVPVSRWDPALFWDPDKATPDKSYAKIGAFVTDFQFNPRRFRIPPSVARLVDPIQQMALEASADALDDAGYGAGKTFDRERCAVILGNSMGGEITDDYTLRVMFPALRKALDEVPGFAALPDRARREILAAYEHGLKADLPPITEDSMPGELANVVAGRIANALDLGGPNFTTDAACAGSMAAMQAAVKGLQDGDFDMALTGGADRSMGVATYTKFCKIGALSPDGSRPFDAGANGFVMGEGVGILVMKRLEDAERDGDRIYAVLLGTGASSDGKGKGITAPNPAGQERALRRAYENSGVDPAEVDLFECHGTSTVVGDKIEVDALTSIIGSGRRDRPARIGSIKSNLGHLKSAAGAASALKAALALHHATLPPSINYTQRRADLDLDTVPLRVQDRAEAWERGKHPRRVGVSAFGFGGTNFHMVLEEHARGARRSLRQAPASPAREALATQVVAAAPAAVMAPVGVAAISPAPRPGAGAVPVPAGLWAISADSPAEMIARARALKNGRGTPYDADAPLRVAAHAANAEELGQQLDRVVAAVQKQKGYDLLRQRGIAMEDVPCDGKIAFLFTGQGSQYIGMGLDLAERYPIVADTFREADEVMTPLLGRPLTALIRRDPALPEEEQFEALRATEISQPATLTVDIALARLLSAYGVRPDMVAGHSLGEYGAAVAAGMLSFRDALVAVSARGREMAAVKLDDFGKMAGIATSVETVMEVLAEVPGYVVAANKNCPTQTVIAGDSDAVEAAVEVFKSRGITVYPLPVSHAFHSKIVAPASKPLRKVLEQLDLKEPRRKITTNVDSRYYPTGQGWREATLDILAKQVASPVEWIAQVERMYADGARIFVECGPKRALAGFVVSILKHRPHRAIYTNQPKRGGTLSFLDALAELFVLGFPVDVDAAPTTDIFADFGARRSTTPLLSARAALPPGAAQSGAPAVQREILDIVARKTGYPVDALDLDFELEADLGIDTVKLADIISSVREAFKLDADPDFRMGEHRTLRSLIDYAGRRIGATAPMFPVTPERTGLDEPVGLPGDVAARFLSEIAAKDLHGLDPRAFAEALLPSLQSFLGAAYAAFAGARGGNGMASISPTAGTPEPARVANVTPAAAPVVASGRYYDGPIVCSGASLGLPGGKEVFADDNVARMLAGENRIDPVPEEQQDRFVAKGLVRLVKDPKSGEGTFLPVESRDQVIRLAGQRTHFDLVADYGVDAAAVRTFDITTQLAFAAGLEALRDAGVPLVRTYRATSTGKAVATGWALPAAWRDTTGIVFGSAFPGLDQLISKVQAGGDDGEGHFDRRFLFQVLAMGHSQFAQFIGARGPNTQVNAACASTTQALAIAEDWLRMRRCERVIVLGSDDVTNRTLMEWIGTGFMAAGAATTESRVEHAALPFDRRRHGMILGMGAVGLVLERDADVRARGMEPVAELLGTRIGNSAFHGTRLDAAHIAREVKAFVSDACAAARVSPAEFASRGVFLSHETYTPARGGSAAAEMAALPAAFGDAARRIVVANTKGFTGHPMGAGIEDVVAIKALQFGRVPPIANLKEPDPELGELHLSKGGRHDVAFALRLAAGFGSQLALAAWRKRASGDARVVDGARYDGWLASTCGAGRAVIECRQLRWIESAPEAGAARAPTPEPSLPAAAAGAAAAAPTGPGVSRDEMLRALLAVVAAKTGYAPEEIDPGYELEADLGIDTVKQAEIFSEMRDRYGLARDEGFKLADYPTVERLAGYLSERASNGADGAPAAARSTPSTPGAADPVPVASLQSPVSGLRSPLPAPGGTVHDEVLSVLVSVVAAKTGYEPSEIDPDYELEADLGIDTVKQAEIFSEVRERFGLLRDERFRLADYPSLSALAGYLAAQRAGSAPEAAVESVAAPGPAPTTLAPERPEPAPADPAATVPRFADAAPPEPADEPPHGLPPSFRIRRPVRVTHPILPAAGLKGKVCWILGGGPVAEALRAAVERAGGSAEGQPDVVVDVDLPVLEGFAQARRLDAEPPRQWVAVVAPPADLRAARDNGARAGLAKALGREWPGCRARVVSLEGVASIDDAAAAILDELGEPDRAVEAWLSAGSREVGALATEPFPAPAAWLPDPVVILTGGTRGITAQVAMELARRGPCRLILVARTPPGVEPLDEAAARGRAKDDLGAVHGRVTPKMIEDALRPLRLAEEARQNVAAMRALGARVEVMAIELADTAVVREMVERVLVAHGRVDGCVHGAGVEESRLLADKDEAAFRRVFEGKAEGGLALAEALPSEAWFVSMGSIAGRFGNVGQVDYSAANEAMAQVCLARPRSLHVAWTAWGEVGMAVRGGMETLLTQRGVELLPARAGAALLGDMIAAGMEGEVVVAGRIGDFTQPAQHPLLDTVELVGDTAIGRRALSLLGDPWMADHAIENVPVLPGVIGLEMMAGAALAIRPRGRYLGVEDVRFEAPCKLYRDAPTHVEVCAEDLGGGAVRCTLSSSRLNAGGRAIVTRHFEAKVQLDEMPLLPALGSALYPEERISQRDIYRRFFHGASFQVLRGAEALAVQGILAEAVVEHGPIAEGVLTDPLVLEVAFQAAALHRMATAGVMALPSSIDAVELVRSAIEGEPLQVIAQLRGDAYDIDVDGPEGRVLRVRGFRMVDRGPLPPDQRFAEPGGGWASIGSGSAGDAPGALSPRDVTRMSARGNAKRIADRLAGQLAGRRAVGDLAGAETFEIERLPSGEPVVVGAGDIHVSITHGDGEALAMAARGARVGIDAELVERRSDAFSADWFTAHERACAGEDPAALTATWAIKEAVLKALGTGMAISPREVEVLDLAPATARVQLHGQARARHQALGGAPIRVRVARRGERVVASAVFAA